MAALVQTFPAQQSASSLNLMQPRSQSSSGTLHGASQGQSNQRNNSPRYNTNGVGAGSSYRGHGTAPVAPYAFTSTPGLSASKSVGTATAGSKAGGADDTRQPQISSEPPSLDLTLRVSQSQTPPPQHSQTSTIRPMDDESIQQESKLNVRPLMTGAPMLTQSISSPTREKPDRYKRVKGQVGVPSGAMLPGGSVMPGASSVYNNPSRANSTPSLPNINGLVNHEQNVTSAPLISDYEGQLRSKSVDDIYTYRNSSQHLTHSRRRSVGPGSITAEHFQTFLRQELSGNKTDLPIQPATAKGTLSEFKPPVRPGSRRTGSTASSASGSSSRASSNRNSIISTSSSSANILASITTPHEVNMAHVPPRGSSTDGAKRTTAPSPLSRSETGPSLKESEPEGSSSAADSSTTNSSAADQLAVLHEGQRKGMKNRLRRAFSFGSAAELRKASAQNIMRGEEAAQRARLRQERFQEEQEAEQARIAKRQEAAGLGESIYSGQGNFFAGSTDNISVSSTASSASIMIRKMGKGIKKSSRNLVGIFRPKSVTGVEVPGTPVSAQASTGPVSMVTIEAERDEREKVNVNPYVADQTGGGTGFPRLERNSLDLNSRPETGGRSSSGQDTNRRRRSIVGSDRDRAEILASVRKGILKRSGSSSPITKPMDSGPYSQLPDVPPVAGVENQRPSSGARSSSARADGDDGHVMPMSRFNASPSSAPASPNSNGKYNVSFSPRITFHDTWPSGEYDRRGEVATCNRLTPTLAQQIKEELNTFKMEMDVHEESKIYTHFF